MLIFFVGFCDYVIEARLGLSIQGFRAFGFRRSSLMPQAVYGLESLRPRVESSVPGLGLGAWFKRA